MTIPIERTNAVRRVRAAIFALAPYSVPRNKRQTTAHVPLELLQDLLRATRHYPGDYHIEMAARKAPDVFAETEDK